MSTREVPRTFAIDSNYYKVVLEVLETHQLARIQNLMLDSIVMEMFQAFMFHTFLNFFFVNCLHQHPGVKMRINFMVSYFPIDFMEFIFVINFMEFRFVINFMEFRLVINFMDFIFLTIFMDFIFVIIILGNFQFKQIQKYSETLLTRGFIFHYPINQ